MFELNQIRQFLKVVECGTILKASDSLNMTQPGLSRSMHRLEEELGISLFVRTKNTIALNENGKKAWELFKNLYENAEEIEKILRLFDQSQQVITVLSPSPTLFEKFLERFNLAYPNLKMETRLAHYDEMVESLLSEKCQMIQLAFPLENENVYNAVFEEESLYLILPESHPLSKKSDGVYLKDIDGEAVLLLPQTGYWNANIERILTSSHFIHQEAQGDFETLLSASTLPTFMTDTMLETYGEIKGRKVIPLLDERLNLTVYSCCLKKNRMRFERFFELSGIK